jgi:hypothetical protein
MVGTGRLCAILPQVSQPVDKPPSGLQWLHEIKLEGFRMAARVDDGWVQLLTRTGLGPPVSVQNSAAQIGRRRRVRRSLSSAGLTRKDRAASRGAAARLLHRRRQAHLCRPCWHGNTCEGSCRSAAPLGSVSPHDIASERPVPHTTRFGSPLVLSRVHWVEPRLVVEILLRHIGLRRATGRQAGRPGAARVNAYCP